MATWVFSQKVMALEGIDPLNCTLGDSVYIQVTGAEDFSGEVALYDIDYAAAEYIGRKEGMDISQTLTYLNKKCGMLGLSGVSSDFRDLAKAADEGNYRANLALDVFAYGTKKYIGAYSAALNGVDVIVFTAGVGENDADVRQRTLKNLDYLGVKLDLEKNANCPRGTIAEIQADDSRVKILVIPTNEEVVIARETMAVAKLS